MNKPRRRPDILGQIRSKGDDVVIGRFLDLIDPLDRNAAFALISANASARNRAVLGMHLADSDLDIQPLLKLILQRPDRRPSQAMCIVRSFD